MIAATALRPSGHFRLSKLAALCLRDPRTIKFRRQATGWSTAFLVLLSSCFLFAQLNTFAASDAASGSLRHEETHKAVELDGSDGYVALPDGILKGRREGTIEAWVQYGSLKGLQRFFSFGKFLNDMGCGFPWQQTIKGESLGFFINSPVADFNRSPRTQRSKLALGIIWPVSPALEECIFF